MAVDNLGLGLDLMLPNEGPPLPRSLGIYWPWYKLPVEEVVPGVIPEVAPPAVTPPAYYPPAYYPPAYAPPVYVPPVYAPPAYEAPAYEAPVYAPPVYEPPIYGAPEPVIPEVPFELYTLTGVASPASAGSVNPHEGDFPPDTRVVITAMPYPDYEFDYWGGDASGTSPTTTVIMTEGKSVIAYFKKSEIPVTPPLVTPPPVSVPELPTAQMFGEPVSHLPSQVVLGETWSGSVEIPTLWPAALPRPPVLPSYQAITGVDLNGITAIASSPHFTPGESISLPVSYDTSKLPRAGTYSAVLKVFTMKGTKLFEKFLGALSVLAPAPEPAPPPTPTPPKPPTPPAPPKEYDLSVIIDPAGCGNVQLSPKGKYLGPGRASYPIGTTVTLTVIPTVPGYKFDEWSGDLGTGQLVGSLVMNRDKTVYAHFVREEAAPPAPKPIPPPTPKPPTPPAPPSTFTVDGKSVPTEGGYWQLDPYKERYNLGDTTSALAFARPGYDLDYWIMNGIRSPGGKGFYRLQVPPITKDIYIEAHFKGTS